MNVNCRMDISLRELSQDDYERILEIVRACAARSTRKLYHLYNNFKHNMDDISEKDFLPKMLKIFKQFDSIITKEGIMYGSPQYTEFLNKMEEAFKFFPDDHLFFPYGPMQLPFEESVKEFLDVAVEAIKKEGRRFYRMGIMKNDLLIGCFTIDFDKHKISGYPDETTGDPGIFIIPNCRNNNGIRNWKKVFFLATKLVERFYPFNEQEIPISATTHRVNSETGNMLSPENGFNEFQGTVSHGKYGARRFFTISKENFIKNFRKGMPDNQIVITE